MLISRPAPPPTMAHEGAYIRGRNKSIKMTFKYAGIGKCCAGCIKGNGIKKNFEARCPVSKVINVSLSEVDQVEFDTSKNLE